MTNFVRAFFLLAALGTPVLLWGVIDGILLLSRDDIAAQVIELVVAVAPIIKEDLSVVGEITPAALSAMLIVGSPLLGPKYPARSAVALLAAVVGYVAMVRMSVLLEGPDLQVVLDISYDGAEAKAAATESLRSVVESVRTFAAISVVGVGAQFFKTS